MHSSVSLPKKCSSVWVSGHGYRPVSEQEQSVSMATRGQSQIKYNGLLDVFQLSMAGLANVTTEMGIIYKMFEGLRLKSDYLTPEIVELLHYRSTEYATLTWLVHQIYSNQYDKCQENMVRSKLEELKKEMLVLEELADIEYARFSPPTIVKNPHSNKVYSLKPNPDENTRRANAGRSGSVRLSGYPPHNRIWALYGMYLFYTSDEELAYFSISILPVDEHGFVDPREIIKRNLLTQKNYKNFWKRYLDEKDFSGVPDSHVSDIGDDPEASVAIFKKFCKNIGITNSARRRKVVLKHRVIAEHIKVLQDAVTIAADTIRDAIRQLRESANNVTDARAEFKRMADLADKAEEKYNALVSRINTRFESAVIEHALLAEYNAAEAIWQQSRIALDQAKANHAAVNERAEQLKNSASEVITDAIKKCIDDIIRSSEEHAELKRILKNIIMSNKLKNILKTAIVNKKISLKQIILFFSGLEHGELGIADPACSVIKPLQNPQDVDAIRQIDTQELDNPSFVLPPLFEDILDFIDKELYHPMASPKHRRYSRASRTSRASRASPASHTSHTSHWSGGAKRKHRMRRYSPKRHTRRRRYTRRRAS
jgi:hypothetical protein